MGEIGDINRDLKGWITTAGLSRRQTEKSVVNILNCFFLELPRPRASSERCAAGRPGNSTV